ncbi:ATP-binding protein [Escherichia coli]
MVERPASVVKELVENSLDAGATRIDIDIERGGAKSASRIRDNGCGIERDLSWRWRWLVMPASKIASLDDLEAIISLGFRGEALASISSVSRLTLTSRGTAGSLAGLCRRARYERDGKTGGASCGDDAGGAGSVLQHPGAAQIPAHRENRI